MRFRCMRKLLALARAFAIVFVALLPGVGALFTVNVPERPAPPPLEGRFDLVGTYDDDALRLGLMITNAEIPRGGPTPVSWERAR